MESHKLNYILCVLVAIPLDFIIITLFFSAFIIIFFLLVVVAQDRRNLNMRMSKRTQKRAEKGHQFLRG